MRNRVKKLFKNVGEDLDVIVIAMGTETRDNTFFYVTGLEEGLFETAIALIYPDGNHEILCPRVEEGSVKNHVHIFHNADERNRLLKDRITGGKIGINGDCLSYRGYKNFERLFPNAQFFDVWKSIAKTRVIKDDVEIQHLKKACDISAKIAEHLPSVLKDTMRECDVKAEIDYMMERENTSPAFETIVAFGIHSAQPHHRCGYAKLATPALCDFGARYSGYCADVTRTCISGNAQKKIFEIVDEGQTLALDMMKDEVKSGDVAKCVNAFFSKKGYRKMVHSLGHSIGRAIHDGFSINEKNDELLRENMVLAVEPALYFKNRWGIRIEDDVIVKKNSVDVLTR